MRSVQRAVVASAAALVVTLTSLTGSAAASPAAGPGDGPTGPDAGVAERTEAAPRPAKHTRRPTVKVRGKNYPAPNPYLSQGLGTTPVDWSYWRSRFAAEGVKRERTRAARRAVPTPTRHVEAEPRGTFGRNDDAAGAERLANLGVGRAFQAADIRGSIGQPPAAARRFQTREDQGSIPLATNAAITAAFPRAVVSSVIGDGPHGARRSGSGDFDFYKVRALAGQSIVATTIGSDLDTILALYDAQGRILDFSDDTFDGIHSELTHPVATTGDYYVMVGGYSDFGEEPEDPFDSGSGYGAGAQGPYQLQVTSRRVDRDFFGVRLASGDVLGGTMRGEATTIQVHKSNGRRMVGSEQDASSAYPTVSPLPGGGATFAYVAEEPGWYAVSAQNGVGDGAYRMLLETYRPGSQTKAAGAVQKIFLDFNGARLNTNIFGGFGVSTLSPLRSFLARWAIPNSNLDAVIDATVAGVEENLDETLRARGLNDDLRVEILNSRDDADPFGQPNVSRVVVGGTINETGVPTIGIAQSIDPGNFGSEETALLLLDEVSSRPDTDYSFNRYLKASSNRVAFVGQAMSNLISHEVGHFIGSFHTVNTNSRDNLMDSGGEHFAQMYGVGADRVGGTADDTDVNFGEDGHDPEEGFVGLEDTLNNSAWAFLPGAG